MRGITERPVVGYLSQLEALRYSEVRLPCAGSAPPPPSFPQSPHPPPPPLACVGPCAPRPLVCVRVAGGVFLQEPAVPGVGGWQHLALFRVVLTGPSLQRAVSVRGGTARLQVRPRVAACTQAGLLGRCATHVPTT